MSVAMQDDRPRDNSARRKVIDRAIAGARPQLRRWVEELRADVEGAGGVIRAACDEFAAEMEAAAEVIRAACDEFAAEMEAAAEVPSILGSPDLTFARLRSIARQMIAHRKVIDGAIASVLPQLHLWVEGRTASVEDPKKVIRAAHGEFAVTEMRLGAQGPSILGSPDLTFARLRSIAGQMIADRAISRDRVRPRLFHWIRKQVLDWDGAEEITQETCITFSKKVETWKPEILASPPRTFGLLKAIAKYKIADWLRRRGRRNPPVTWSNIDNQIRHYPGDANPFGFEGPAEVRGDDQEPIDEIVNGEDEEQARRSLEKLMGFLDEREYLVISAYGRVDVSDDEIAKQLDEQAAGRAETDPANVRQTTKENVRQIRSRAFQKIRKAKALEDLCDEIAEVLSGRERDAVRACCWSGQDDEEAANRLGTGPEVVRRFRDGVFEKIRREASVRGVPWDGPTTRVIWAALRLDQSDPAIAEGLGLALKKVASIKRRALGKMPGEPDH